MRCPRLFRGIASSASLSALDPEVTGSVMDARFLVASVEAHVDGFGLVDFGGVVENESLRGGIFVSRNTLAKEDVLNL